MPYDPHVQSTIGQSIERGLLQAGDALGRGIADYTSASKKARSLRSYMGEVEPEAKGKFDAMSLSELEGYASAYAAKQSQRAAAVNLGAKQAETEELKARTAGYRNAQDRAAQEYAAKQRFAGIIAQKAKPYAGPYSLENQPPAKVTPGDLADAAAQADYPLDPMELARYTSAFARDEAAGRLTSRTLTPESVTTPWGEKIMTVGGTVVRARPEAQGQPDGPVTYTDPGGQEWRYTGKSWIPVTAKAPVDPSQFETGPDGKLTAKGFGDWVLSQKLGAYPGMPVGQLRGQRPGQPAAAPPSASPPTPAAAPAPMSLWERYQQQQAPPDDVLGGWGTAP